MTRFDVLVVGAGAAGLIAARDLARAGFSVGVLEARERAGGRMDTRRLPADGVAAELGAEFIHGKPAITLALLREAGIDIVKTGQEQARFVDGTLRRSGDERFAAVTDLFARIDPDAPDESLDAFLQREASAASMEDVRAYARAMVEGFDAADPADASVHALREEWLGAASIEEGSYRPASGYGALVDHLVRSAEGAGATIHYGTIVDRIDWNDGIAVEAHADGRAAHFDATRAVLTVPLGVLEARGIAFSPELPARTMRAIAALAMGPVVKLVLQFDSRFWERARGGDFTDIAFFQSFETPFNTIWTPMPQKAPLLTAWAGGAQAHRFRDLSERARLDLALESVASIFGMEVPEVRARLVRAVDHDWQADPFSRGAYSYARVGAGDARKCLAEPLGRLHLAGEATAETAQAGTVAGALESGQRAAREIISRMPCS